MPLQKWLSLCCLVATSGCYCGIPEFGQKRRFALQNLSTLDQAACTHLELHGALPLERGQMVCDAGCVLREWPSDFWGTEYRLQLDGGKVWFESAGKDKTWGTRDDLQSQGCALDGGWLTRH